MYVSKSTIIKNNSFFSQGMLIVVIPNNHSVMERKALDLCGKRGKQVTEAQCNGSDKEKTTKYKNSQTKKAR